MNALTVTKTWMVAALMLMNVIKQLPIGFANTRCSNTDGSYQCYCQSGYILVGSVIEGDPSTVCEDVNECEPTELNNRSLNASCENIDGGYHCACNTVYSGTGFTCFDDDECDLGTHNCDNNGRCSNIEGSSSCSCNLGYVGAGDICDDVNECLQSPCDTNSTCNNTIGSYICTTQDSKLTVALASMLTNAPMDLTNVTLLLRV